MRTVLLANNHLGASVAEYLAERGELDLLVLHPEEKRTAGDRFADLPVEATVWPEGLDRARELAPECLLSVLFAYKVPLEWLAVPGWLPLNLHPGYLPYNRGAAPNVWPIVDGSPAGTTLHVMEEQIDAGPFLCQEQVSVYPDDTAATLYRRLEAASLEMLRSHWPDLRNVEPRPQPPGGSTHRRAALAELDLVDADFPVLDRLRARTFPPYGAEFIREGRRYVARVEIEPLDAARERPSP